MFQAVVILVFLVEAMIAPEGALLSADLVMSSVVAGGDSSNAAVGEEESARKVVVVVSTKNPVETIKLKRLQRIFLRKETQWKNGWSITVFERSVDDPIKQKFNKLVIQKKQGTLKEYWMNLKLTRGVKPPKVLRSVKLVKRYLQRVKGGIAYIYADEVDDTVKVVRIEDRYRDD